VLDSLCWHTRPSALLHSPAARTMAVAAVETLLPCSLRAIAPSTGPVRSSLAPSLMCLHCLQTDKDVKSRMESLLADITLLRGLFFEALRQSSAFKVTTLSISVSTPSRALCSRDGPRARQNCVAAPCALELSRSAVYGALADCKRSRMRGQLSLAQQGGPCFVVV
jgi:hypothetical protein